MDRRSLLLGLLGVAGTAALAKISTPAMATTLDSARDVLPNLDGPDVEDVLEEGVGEAPDGTPIEEVQYRRRRRRRSWRRRNRYWRRRNRRYWRRRRRRVCGWRWRYGRRYWRCWWGW